jgi:hypothetical protein
MVTQCNVTAFYLPKWHPLCKSFLNVLRNYKITLLCFPHIATFQMFFEVPPFWFRSFHLFGSVFSTSPLLLLTSVSCAIAV